MSSFVKHTNVTPTQVGDIMRNFAATVGFVSLLAVIFVGAFGVA